ncbi:Septum formation initiator [uncultured Clostridium sp.]|uniref:Septum formation initiator family protein n=1 Tax=Paeniclostridium hominis TaxID=2764329 RepID=A0ABR7K6Q3_9FIRM|nr:MULTISPECIES: septum formation initiator family protein [Paeniclostridium]MDU1540364.1 septum formation initiator family protein [Paeniclostridium sordellii]SCJ43179.1 Septum formation initiator [uncultured Clostridium sp.]MBC6004773.1 septum formation initiator family protein [Paeniclostridium hominis]MDU2591921.1 septum formation initiator family protein [Paeniclostridium sordellii]SCJ43260.1 Septum formation initiator [uncultured Clostridium sp.]
MNKRKKFIGQYIVVGMFLCLVGISLIGGVATQIIKSAKYKNDIICLKNEIKNTEKEIKSLKEAKKKIDNDKYIEEIARKKLKMVKPNEIIYLDINRGSN